MTTTTNLIKEIMNHEWFPKKQQLAAQHSKGKYESKIQE